MIWEPIDLVQSCPASAQFAACSYFGLFYLKAIVDLYGDSVDTKIQSQIEHEKKEENIIEQLQMNRPYGRKDENTQNCDDEDLKGCEMDDDDEGYDFIVVGAGAAGAVVANRLATHHCGYKVLLLERGPEQPSVTLVPAFAGSLLRSNIVHNFKTVVDGKNCLAQPDKRCNLFSGYTMGGGSSVNSLAFVRGNRIDYDTWAAMGNDGWSYEEILPYFKKSENNLDYNNKYHGVGGDLTISKYPCIDDPSRMMTEAYNQRGLPLRDFNGEHQVGTMQAQAFADCGQRVSTNNAFIQPIRYKLKNLTVRVESLVLKILIDDNNEAYGVTYLIDGKLCNATATKEVIISAGPINSAKLLMLSGIGPKDHLNDVGIKVIKDLPVGENLHDHVTFDGMLVVLPNGTATTVALDQQLNDAFDYKVMKNKSGPLSGNGPVNSIAFIKTDPNLPAPDVQYQADIVPSWREYVKDPAVYKSIMIFPDAYYDGIVVRGMNVAPKSRGQMYLNDTDPYADPIIDINYFGEIEDMTTIIKSVKFMMTLEETKAFKERGAYFYKQSLHPCEAHEWGTEEYIYCMARAHTSTTYHQAGTCKMGPACDKGAVVDPRLKVYGIKRLRTIDSSIMPNLPRGNTNAPTIMVAERGVAFVLEDWEKCESTDE